MNVEEIHGYLETRLDPEPVEILVERKDARGIIATITTTTKYPNTELGQIEEELDEKTPLGVNVIIREKVIDSGGGGGGGTKIREPENISGSYSATETTLKWSFDGDENISGSGTSTVGPQASGGGGASTWTPKTATGEEVVSDFVSEMPMAYDEDIKLGQAVMCQLTEGGAAKGVAVEDTGETAYEYNPDFDSNYGTLMDLWEDQGHDVDPGETVWMVDLDRSNGKAYAFPESKIRPRGTRLVDVSGVGQAKAEALKDFGYHTIEALKAAKQEELTAVDGIGPALAARIKADVGDLKTGSAAEMEVEPTFECNWCFQEFVESHETKIEGEDGNLYCSLDCLNNELA